jgi:hypothetical protein
MYDNCSRHFDLQQNQIGHGIPVARNRLQYLNEKATGSGLRP